MSTEPRPALTLVAAPAGDALYAEWLPTVTQWCRRMGGRAVDPDDAAQDVMLVLLRRLPELRVTEARAAWIFAVTRRVLAAHRRRAWLRRWAGLSTPDLPDPRLPADAALDAHTRSLRVEQALGRLRPEAREVIVLVDIEERSLQETAVLLDVPIGTVKSRLSRAREHFATAARHVGLSEEA